MFGPDTSTSNRATLGGMIGNNSAGSGSVRYGMTIDHVTQLDVVLVGRQRARSRRSTRPSARAEPRPPAEASTATCRDRRASPRRDRARTTRALAPRPAAIGSTALAARPSISRRFVVGSEGTLVVATEATAGWCR